MGRRTELAVLHDLISAAGPEAPGVVEIVGDPGIGKTRLLTEWADLAARSGWLVLSGRAAEFEQQVPFGVFGAALEDHPGLTGGNGPTGLAELDVSDLRLLRSVFPVLPAPPDEAPVQAVTAERYRLHRAVRTLLEVLSRQSGLLLVLDDLHWADIASTELVEYLLRHPPRGRLLLAVAHRRRQTSARLRHALARAVHSGMVERMELGPLTPADVDELLPADADPTRRRRLYEASGGNPLYLQALAAPSAGGDEQDPGPRPVDARGHVPEPVRAALVAELDALAPRTLLVAQACAVAGDQVGVGLVARTAGLDVDAVVGLLDELVRHDVVRPAATGGRFEFRHPLVRRVAYDTAGAGWRVAAHTRAAAALHETGAPAAELAHHVERSAERGDARGVEVLREAAAATLHQSPATAVHWLRAALRLVPDGPDWLPARLDLLGLQAQAYGLIGQFRDSRGALHELRRLLPAELTEQQARIIAFCAMVEHRLGRHAEARAQLLAGLAALPDEESPAGLALKIGLATGVARRLDPVLDRDWPAEALTTARRLADRAALACTLAIAVVARHTRGLVDEETVALLDEAAALADTLPDGELARLVETLVWLGWAEVCQERLDDGVRHMLRGLDIARAAGQSHLVNFLHGNLGIVHILRGDLERAAGHLDDELDAVLLTGSEALHGPALRNQCWLAISAGDTENALRLAKEALACAEGGGSPDVRLATGLLGIAHLFADDPATCVDLMMTAAGGDPELRAVDPLERTAWHEALAAAEAALGHLDKATAWADRAFAHAAGLPRRTGVAHLARAHALLPGDPARAAAEALRSAELLLAAGDRLMAARAHAVAAVALAADSRPDAAREQFAESTALLQACGAQRHKETALREQRRMNARQPRRSGSRREPADGGTPTDTELTPRERQVAELAARGLTNREIGRALYISPRTVNVHLSRVFAKLGVSRRAALAGRLPPAPDDN
ncbi:helix-turn-helix transcriptional regulator [Streptomyces capitiformicae]|uniref:HTH luxR-type domain-containing protein n=1 Tax=Streptomyces capitiformicae TaxID=2014920 RepID=A0A918Z442_9ACTN|nr:LuxR family transcriptional regulator [Streptomyces capitiformicae]GHE36145.1 hypothetical protein GCM10017771_54230 [Streptomyces capitiformicae]